MTVETAGSLLRPQECRPTDKARKKKKKRNKPGGSNGHRQLVPYRSLGIIVQLSEKTQQPLKKPQKCGTFLQFSAVWTRRFRFA
jgi:hypothetical protein